MSSATPTPLLRLCLACALALACVPRPAAAQAFTRLEVSAGYAWMNDTTDGETLPAGWAVGVAADLTKWLSLAGDAGGQYKTVSIFGSDLKLRTYALMGGLRASARLGPFIEFGQVLAGVSHATGTAFGSTDTVTHVAWQPGLGLDLPVSRCFRARAEVDQRFVSNVRELRVVGAIVSVWRRQ